MKTLAVFAALLAAAVAQFSCDTCDSAGNRKARTGCRFFCYFDTDNEGVITRHHMTARFNADKDTDAGMTRGKFVEQMMTIVKFCKDEAEAGFDLIVDLGGGSRDLLTEQDIHTLADLFEVITGSTVITRALWQDVYALLYLTIGNNNCPAGL